MAPPRKYLHDSQWANEGSNWRPSTTPPTPDVITLRDEAGTVISSSSMTTMTLTLYDLMTTGYPVLDWANQVNCKNARSCTINTSGVFVLNLLPEDTVILDTAHDYELRRALVQYTWASGAKSDALEVTFIVRNLRHRNETAVSVMRVLDTAQVTLV